MNIFPLHPNSKIPATKHGHKDAMPAQSWTDMPDGHNWGLVTGQLNGVTVIDFDSHELAESFSHLRPPYYVRTPRGEHWYYAYDPELRTTTRLGGHDGLDVRNDGAYVVMAGSQVDGNVYRPSQPELELPAVPDAFKEMTTTRPDKSQADADTLPGRFGGRNHFLTSVGGSLRRQGLEEDAIRDALLSINDTTCTPPLEEAEVEKIAWSVSRYEPELEEEADTGAGVKADSLVESMYEYLNDPNRSHGIPSGIQGFDELMGGGFRAGEVIAIHAPGKTGKSTLLHKLIHNLISREVAVGYASREMYPDTEVLPDLLSMELKKSVFKQHLPFDRYKAIVDRWPLYFSDGYGVMQSSSLERFIKYQCEENDAKVIFIDHLQFMVDDEDYKEMARIIKDIVKYAKENSVAVVVVIQPKNVDRGQKLGLHTLRGGAALGQGITALFTMEREDEVRQVSKVALVAKRSKLAKTGEFFLHYDSSSHDLVEVDFIPEPASEKEDDTPAFDRATNNRYVQGSKPKWKQGYR